MAGKRKYGGTMLFPATRKSQKIKAEQTRRMTPLITRILRSEAERKELTTGTNGNAVSIPNTAGTVVTLNLIAEGSDYNQRTGRKIRMHNLEFTGWPFINSISGYTGSIDNVLVSLVIDKQPNGTAATGGVIYDQTTAYPGQCFRNTFNWENRFKVIWEERIAFDPGSGLTCQFKKYVDFAKFGKEWTDVDYNGTSASVPNSNALYLYFGSLNAECDMTYTAKLKYYDM